MTLLLLIAAVFCRLISAENPDAELDRPTRVVNGEPVPNGLAEWQVSIQTPYGAHFCGGTLIAPRWVLTACHCTMERNESDIRVGLGGKHIRSLSKFYDVKRIIRHEFYNTTTLINDIALLELNSSDEAIPRGLAAETITRQQDEDFVSEKCYVTGFGRLELGGAKAQRLMEAQVPLYTYEECRGAFASNYYITQGHVCAGGQEKDACQGDSGGPLACCKADLGTAENCTLVGVTTWGIGCAIKGIPGVYTKVAHYNDWIDAKISGKKDFKSRQFKDRGGWNLFQQMQNFFVNPMVPYMDN